MRETEPGVVAFAWATTLSSRWAYEWPSSETRYFRERWSAGVASLSRGSGAGEADPFGLRLDRVFMNGSCSFIYHTRPMSYWARCAALPSTASRLSAYLPAEREREVRGREREREREGERERERKSPPHRREYRHRHTHSRK